jgi:large subunit ribosomal protein L21
MSKAVIATGGKQYIVSEGDTLNVELIAGDDKKVTFEPLMVIDGATSKVGKAVGSVKVTADVVEETKADKVVSIRYKAKKRVHKLHGHRQRLTTIKIAKIA